MTIFSDKALSQKMERANGRSNADFVEAHAKLFPDSGAEWIEVAGVYVMFDGTDSPTTQTFGLGLFDEITDVEMDRIEDFFNQRNAPVNHEVSPMADPGVFPVLNERGYQPIEFSNTLYKKLDSPFITDLVKNSPISTRIIDENEVDLFAETSAKGWLDEMPEYAEMMFKFSRIGASAKGAIPFLAELEEKPIASGTLYIYDDVAILAGASTIPEARRQGAQNVLLAARLNYALKNDCKVAMMDALPGSQSQRNAEKNGFRVAYTRTKWQLKR
jgi:hypothetical protein